eukprot:CAMPEP_0118641512 /NCGR_PEP_ID=MMETSP0785-20121206/5323_1 /TAXON_ID=91992 /ORGANISM="Bolidomonas pacifica, Strain CCMP 1866" /LENGTH=35 /DNA_ID= /DNA_START= /DNA_END= /DNA_ORIENTATION=
MTPALLRRTDIVVFDVDNVSTADLTEEKEVRSINT